jgi:molybdopterin converting factor small subunit
VETGAVTVEFYGIPRQRAGVAELQASARTVGDLLGVVEHACPGLAGLLRPDGRLTPHYLLSINGQHFVNDVNELLRPGDRLLLLSADAGG